MTAQGGIPKTTATAIKAATFACLIRNQAVSSGFSEGTACGRKRTTGPANSGSTGGTPLGPRPHACGRLAGRPRRPERPGFFPPARIFSLFPAQPIEKARFQRSFSAFFRIFSHLFRTVSHLFRLKNAKICDFPRRAAVIKTRIGLLNYRPHRHKARALAVHWPKPLETMLRMTAQTYVRSAAGLFGPAL